jgi:hypothetical protein
VRIFSQDMDLCHLTSILLAFSVCTVEIVLSLLGQYRLIGEGAALTRRAVASAHTVAAHASAHLQQTIMTPCSHACRAQ